LKGVLVGQGELDIGIPGLQTLNDLAHPARP
jgi:hypothetical protein